MVLKIIPLERKLLTEFEFLERLRIVTELVYPKQFAENQFLLEMRSAYIKSNTNTKQKLFPNSSMVYPSHFEVRYHGC